MKENLLNSDVKWRIRLSGQMKYTATEGDYLDTSTTWLNLQNDIF